MKILLSILKYLFIVLIISTVVFSFLGSAFFIYFSKGLPNIITTEDYKPLIVTQVLGKGDVVVGEFFEEKRYVIPLEKIPEKVQHAFVSAEDDRFFEHQGIDLQGIARAAIANFKAGKVVQGGSTITQQVAKGLLLTPEKSFFRKAKEVILANRMEKNLNKKQILYLYLNQIYLGSGAYGIEAAARTYFNKSAKELTIAEGAILAGLPQAPSKYSPLLNPKMAKQRQQYVLRRMSEDGVITKTEMEDALKQQIKIYHPQDINLKYAPYYIEQIRKHLLEKFGKDALYQSGLTVKTPIDPTLSQVAMKAIQLGLHSVDKRQGYRGPIKKNKTQDAMTKAIEEVADYNANLKYPFKILMTDGTHSHDPKAKLNDKEQAFIFDDDKIYQAVVTGIDDGRHEVSLNLGMSKGLLPLDKMRWAQPVKVPSSTGVDPISRPSQALSKGDQILVKWAGEKNGVNIFSLEQIPVVQGALFSMDVLTGEVISMVGGYDFKESEFNRAIQAERQAGSTYKAIIYSAAVDKGYTASTIIQDSPIVFSAGENEKWKPENFEEKFYGDTIFRSALIRSRNIPTIKIVQDIQVPYLIDYSKRLGLPDKFNNDLSIALGSSTVSLMDLCKVYAVYPRGGRKVKPLFIHKVIDRDGKVIEENQPTVRQPPLNPIASVLPKPILVAGEIQAEHNAGKDDPNRGVWQPDPNDPDRVLDPRTAFVMTHLMNEVATMGTGHEAKALGRPSAGKTGTTNDYLDAWFMGFIPQMVTGVWVGFDSQKSIAPKATGAQIALPIWLEYMKEAVKNYPVEDFQPPKGISYVTIDPNTGRPVSPNRSNALREVFIEGTEPAGSTILPAANNDIGAPSKLTNLPAPGKNAPVQRPETDLDDSSRSSDDFFKEDIQ